MNRGCVIIFSEASWFIAARPLTLTLSPEGERGQPLDVGLKFVGLQAEGRRSNS